MAKARAVLKRLKAVKNIRKITRTMELIATARFKKAMDRRPRRRLHGQNRRARLRSDPVGHRLLTSSDGSPRGAQAGVLLVLTSKPGFVRRYNSSVLKLAQQRMRDAKAQEQRLFSNLG